MVKTKKVKTTKPRTITPNERVLLRYLLNEKNPMDMNSIMSGTNLTWNEINTANTNLKSNVLMPDSMIIRTGKWGVDTKYKLLDNDADSAEIAKNFDFLCRKIERAMVQGTKVLSISRKLPQYRNMQLQLQTSYTKLITNVSMMQMGNLPTVNI